MSDSELTNIPEDAKPKKKEVRRPLKVKDYKFIAAKTRDPEMPNYKAAMIATGANTYGSAAVEANRMLKNANLREALDEGMAEQGWSINKILTPVTEALEDEDLDRRLKGHDRAMRVIQMAAGDDNKQGSTIQFNNIQVNNKFIKKDES